MVNVVIKLNLIPFSIMQNKMEKYHTVYGSIELASTIAGLILNGIALPYFISRREHFSNVLYILIVITDIITCLVSIPSSLSYLIKSYPVLAEQLWLCTLTGVLFQITARFSVFLIAVLSVCRTACLLFPLRKLNQAVIGTIVITIYLILLIVQALLPIFFTDEGYVYRDFIGYCSWAVEWLSFVEDVKSPEWHGLVYAFIILPWLLPGLVVVVSTAITIWRLLKSHWVSQSLGEYTSNQTKSATFTVVILTLLYVLFNMPCWMFYLAVIWSIEHPVRWLQSGPGVHVGYFVSKLSVEFNALCNPFVYMLRMRRLNIKAGIISHRIRNLTQTLSRIIVSYKMDLAMSPPPNSHRNKSPSCVFENDIVLNDVCHHSKSDTCDNIKEKSQ